MTHRNSHLFKYSFKASSFRLWILHNPVPVSILIFPCPAASQRKLFIDQLLHVFSQTFGISKNERLAFPFEEKLFIFIPILVTVDSSAKLSQMGTKSSFRISSQKHDLWSLESFLPHLKPGIKQQCMSFIKSGLVGDVNEDKVNSCSRQHVCMFSIHPCIRVSVIAEIRFCPVSFSALGFQELF